MKITEKTFDITTGEETFTERDETAAETKARLDFVKAQAEAKAEADAKAAEKTAVLAKLGLTADEVAALLS
jgi:hypothetical protein